MKRHYRKQYREIERMAAGSLEKMTADLAHLMTFATVSGSDDPHDRFLYRNELARGYSFLNGLSREMGLSWRNYGNRVCVAEMRGEGREVIGVPLHIDVVPPGEGWRYPAFGGMIEDGVLYGRGAQDNKGPIISTLYALWFVKQLGLPFRRTVRLIVASQEETGDWDDVESYLEKEPAPDFSIVPDSDFPIVNGEKGMANIRVAISWTADDSARGALRFHDLRAGERPNIVPNRADIAWSTDPAQASGVSDTLALEVQTFLKENRQADAFPLRFERDRENGSPRLHLTFLGKSAHGSKPEHGHNAAIDALKFLSGAPDSNALLRETTAFLAKACADPHGAGLDLELEHEFIGKTTINLGMARVQAESAEIVINVRPTYGTSCAEVLGAVRRVVSRWARERPIEATVELANRPHEPLFVDPKTHPELIGALQEAFTRVTGAPAELTSRGSTTFSKAFPNAVGFGPVYLAEEENRLHQADECVRIVHLERNAKIYALALLLLAT